MLKTKCGDTRCRRVGNRAAGCLNVSVAKLCEQLEELYGGGGRFRQL